MERLQRYKKPWLNIHAHERKHDDELTILNCSPRQAIAETRKNTLPVSAGIHPWYSGRNDEDLQQLELLKELAGMPTVVAIGEGGLDRSISLPFGIQEELFIAQAVIARDSAKPMIIHCVKAYPDIVRLRKRFSSAPPWIIHGFTGNAQALQQLLRHNIYISLGVSLTRGSIKLYEAVQELEPGRVFFETDEADIRVEEVYWAFSRFRGTELTELQEKIRENFRKVFKYGNSDG